MPLGVLPPSHSTHRETLRAYIPLAPLCCPGSPLLPYSSLHPLFQGRAFSCAFLSTAVLSPSPLRPCQATVHSPQAGPVMQLPSFSILLASVLVSLTLIGDTAVAAPAKHDAKTITLPLKRAHQKRADVHPQVVRRVCRILARIYSPSDPPVPAAALEPRSQAVCAPHWECPAEQTRACGQAPEAHGGDRASHWPREPQAVAA